MSVLLDTHMWVWWLTAGAPLTRAERANAAPMSVNFKFFGFALAGQIFGTPRALTQNLNPAATRTM